MANSSDGSPNPLPDELAAALRRATGHTLHALEALRTAVQEHVHSHGSRGVTLDEIDAELRSMIVVAGGDGDHPHNSPERINELSRQVLNWSEAFYLRRR